MTSLCHTISVSAVGSRTAGIAYFCSSLCLFYVACSLRQKEKSTSNSFFFFFFVSFIFPTHHFVKNALSLSKNHTREKIIVTLTHKHNHSNHSSVSKSRKKKRTKQKHKNLCTRYILLVVLHFLL